MKSICGWLLSRSPFSRLLALDREILQNQEELGQRRVEMDRKLDDITRATLNGESEWFLELIKKDPGCAMNVVRECDLGKEVK